MPAPEIDHVYPFQDEIVYSNPNLKPLSIAKGTASIMHLYFNSRGYDHFPGNNFLASHTLPLIDAIRMGLARHPDRVDKFLLASYADVSRAIWCDETREAITDDESLEALNIALLAMADMPSATVTFRDDVMGERTIEFSRRGMLAVPETLEETRNRIHELWIETSKIVFGVTSPLAPIYADSGRARTFMFFMSASNIRLENSDEGTRDMATNFPDYYAQKYIPGE